MPLKQHIPEEDTLTVYVSVLLMIIAVFIAFPAAILAEKSIQNTSHPQRQFVIMPRNCYLTNK
ncbi:hypothetical protein [Salidesulfovibrio onnuriiensis]|uniref:hypothetical protein n=1 Tax=Salidesulfovibrio onnuriiensis TaxID=2583823 RepID=UPI0011C77806|nr:hypothetical protein [Salidesulfovibrio onnuriiensis]